MKVLDLFCGAGGASMGYHLAGFEVVGVDINSQPNYPFEFVQANALNLTRTFLWQFDVIHASPPCQHYSVLAKRNGNADKWPDYVAAVRMMLIDASLPWVIENVQGAPLSSPVTLCGTMFPGLRVLRHRLFETSFDLPQPAHSKHPLVFTHDKRKPHYGQLDQDTSFVQVTGGGNCSIANARSAMGIPWMNKHELNEAIPPAYTFHIARQFLQQLGLAA